MENVESDNGNDYPTIAQVETYVSTQQEAAVGMYTTVHQDACDIVMASYKKALKIPIFVSFDQRENIKKC